MFANLKLSYYRYCVSLTYYILAASGRYLLAQSFVGALLMASTVMCLLALFGNPDTEPLIRIVLLMVSLLLALTSTLGIQYPLKKGEKLINMARKP